MKLFLHSKGPLVLQIYALIARDTRKIENEFHSESFVNAHLNYEWLSTIRVQKTLLSSRLLVYPIPAVSYVSM